MITKLKILLTGMTFLLLVSLTISPAFGGPLTYDFNSLAPGNLDLQDNWQTLKFVSPGDAQVTPGFGADGTQAIRYANSGPNVGLSAARVNDTSFALPSFGSGNASVFVDLLPNHWGSYFGLGYDNDGDGDLGKFNTPELGFFVHVNTRNDEVRFAIPSSTSTSVSLSSLGLFGGWVRLRFDMDFGANGGAGATSISFLDPLTAGSSFQSIAGLQNLSLGLNPAGLDARNAALWDSMYFHIEGATGGIDNIAAQVPEPTTLTLLFVGALALGVGARRKRQL